MGKSLSKKGTLVNVGVTVNLPMRSDLYFKKFQNNHKSLLKIEKYVISTAKINGIIRVRIMDKISQNYEKWIKKKYRIESLTQNLEEDKKFSLKQRKHIFSSLRSYGHLKFDIFGYEICVWKSLCRSVTQD